MRSLAPLVILLVLTGTTAVASGAPEGVPTGGAHYFYCALGQVVKYYGFFTANPALALTGAIVGGLACGFGI